MNKGIGGIVMEMVSLNTNSLGDVGYSESTQELATEFRRGGAYMFSGVPKSVYEGLISALSPDDYYSENIKNNYSYRRVG